MARGKGPKRGGGKRFAAESAEEIEQRNARLAVFDEERAKRRAEAEEGSEDEEEAEAVGDRVAKISLEDEEGQVPAEPEILTRKQREEQEKAAKAAAYRKRHEAGLTEEYKRDMEKLAEVRARREKQAAAKKAAEDEEKRMEEERQKAALAAGAIGEKSNEKKKKSSGPPKLDKITIKKMKPAQLKEALKERDLDIQGNAKSLTARLLKYEEERE